MVTREKNFRFEYVSFYIYIYIYIYGSQSLKNAVCKLGGTGMLLNKPYLGTVSKQMYLVSFFFPLYGSLASCLRYLNTEASKRLSWCLQLVLPSQ